MFLYRVCTTASLLFIYGISGLLFLQSATCKEVNPSKIRVAGENAFAKGNLKDALKLFTQLIEVEPHNERNFYKRFRVYLSERKYSYAISDLTSAIGINPDYEQGFAQRGKLFLMTGECTKAVQDFNQVLRLDNKNTNAHQKLVQAEDCAKKMDEADKAQQRGQFDLAHSLLGEIVDQYAISSQSLLLEKAQLSVALGNSFDAIAESGKALKMDANNIPALMLRGQAYYSLGDMQSIQAAMEHYRQGLHSDPEHKGLKKVYRTVKKLLKRSKSIENAMASQKFEEALEDLESALGIDPQHAVLNKDFHFKKCECHLELHQGEEAKAACSKVIEVEERFAHGHIKLCQALQLTEEFEEAVRECRRGVELDEDNREVQYVWKNKHSLVAQ